MVLPTTWLSALLLLALSFICLGSWASTFKATGNRWRFEMYSIDFAIGALVVALLAAYTLGTLGADLGFSDRMLVAGRTNQALGIAAGAVFALGNMLLLAAVSLLGLSAAFPLCIGSAVVVAALFQFGTSQTLWLAAGVALLLCGDCGCVGDPPQQELGASSHPATRRALREQEDYFTLDEGDLPLAWSRESYWDAFSLFCIGGSAAISDWARMRVCCW